MRIDKVIYSYLNHVYIVTICGMKKMRTMVPATLSNDLSTCYLILIPHLHSDANEDSFSGYSVINLHTKLQTKEIML